MQWGEELSEMAGELSEMGRELSEMGRELSEMSGELSEISGEFRQGFVENGELECPHHTTETDSGSTRLKHLRWVQRDRKW